MEKEKKRPFHQTIQIEILTVAVGVRGEEGLTKAMQLLPLFDLLSRTHIPEKELSGLLGNVEEIPPVLLTHEDKTIARIGQVLQETLEGLRKELPESVDVTTPT